MSGGPYCRPKHWKRNTAVAMFGVFPICIPIAMKFTELEAKLSRLFMIMVRNPSTRKTAAMFLLIFWKIKSSSRGIHIRNEK
ncbi:Transmembrane protein [Quillaja saponaria]|uniref:Transmembrane protein n=1 Tax=Quillaja saponaria TaxID=32244 RepID=A0AAD7LSR3_QUISA|nr:Transmembrane protein [Quillaja saponaria]